MSISYIKKKLSLQGVEAKQFVGGAQILHKELAAHFVAQTFDKPASQLSPLDKELSLHSPNAHDWHLSVFPLQAAQNLHVERAKMILQQGTLHPNGFNVGFSFTTENEWIQFKQWFFPPSVDTL